MDLEIVRLLLIDQTPCGFFLFLLRLRLRLGSLLQSMLLRSASLPLLNSPLVAAGKVTAAAHEVHLAPLPTTSMIAHLAQCCFSSSPSFGSSPSASSPSGRRRMAIPIFRTLSDGGFSDHRFWATPFASHVHSSPINLEEKGTGETGDEQRFGKLPDSTLGGILSNSVLEESGVAAEEEAKRCCVAAADDCADGAGDGGGKICIGGRGRSGGGDDNDEGDGGFDGSDSEGRRDAGDAYYLKMIEANPGNSLILGKYADFLIEVRGDMAKAQEYCERAIVANPGDAGVLALYADVLWQASGDAPRADAYFARAIQAAEPDDCNIMAAYARFLWDSEEPEEGPKRREQTPAAVSQGTERRPSFPPPPPVPAP